MTWKLLDPRMTPEHLGYLPMIIRADDPRPVAEQVADRYAHGGGWSPYGAGKWSMAQDGTLTYNVGQEDADDPLQPLAVCQVGSETVRFYAHAIVSVSRPGGSLDVVRMD